MLRTLLVLLCLESVLGAFDSCSDAGGDTAAQVASSHNLTGHTVIVTGGDGGLGFAVVQSLAARNATVVLASHNLNKTEAAAATIRAAGGDAKAMHLDLSSLASVRDFASQFLGNGSSRLDLLINNAGIDGPHSDFNTSDGFEVAFQVNYLGHFLLTELLLPALRKTTGARVVNVASTWHGQACQWCIHPLSPRLTLQLVMPAVVTARTEQLVSMSGGCRIGHSADCLKDFSNFPPKTVTGKAWDLGGMQKSNYGLSKFFLIQHAKQLATQEPGIEAYSVGPGLVNTSINNSSEPWASWLFCEMPQLPPAYRHMVWKQSVCPYQPNEGAAVIAACALSKSDAVQNGEWITRYSGCTPGNVTMSGFTDQMRPELYKRSLELVGLKGRL